MNPTHPSLAIVSTLPCVFGLLASVLIVDPAQPGAFHDIQSACNATPSAVLDSAY